MHFSTRFAFIQRLRSQKKAALPSRCARAISALAPRSPGCAHACGSEEVVLNAILSARLKSYPDTSLPVAQLKLCPFKRRIFYQPVPLRRAAISLISSARIAAEAVRKAGLRCFRRVVSGKGRNFM